MCFQVTGVDDNAEKVRIEAYVLKKITKDLPLHPIQVALKWDHLSDSKQADSDLKTTARIDFMLVAEAEVFISILHDGRQTRLQGMPSAVSACFRWMPFGRI